MTTIELTGSRQVLAYLEESVTAATRASTELETLDQPTWAVEEALSALEGAMTRAEELCAIEEFDAD